MSDSLSGPNTPIEPTRAAGELEIGHVLFVDIVGYSKRLLNEQTALIRRLNDLVRGTDPFKQAEAAGKLITIPTGDGMALVFLTAPDAPLRCAMAINLADQQDPKIELRMGIHSGPIDRLVDVNDHTNVAGAGINMAQRVMDCGDSGHILLSQRIADDLAQHEKWRSHLHDIGEAEVKHGVRLRIVNFYSDLFGNAAVPLKLKEAFRQRQLQRRRTIAMLSGAAFIVTGLLLAGAYFFALHRADEARRRKEAEIPAKSVAVLPFENLSPDPNNAFLSTGIQDEILTRLSKISALKVISRSSTRQYASKPEHLAQVAKELGVAAILEGTVQKVGATVRVNVQLIHAATDAHLWAETYDRELINVLQVESEIASRIANSLQATLSPEEQKRVDAVPTMNPDAYEAYLRAREMLRLSSTAYLPEAGRPQRELYEKAIALDPNFALAHAALAESYTLDCAAYGATPEKKWKAQREAEEALRLQPDLGEAHVALGSYYYRVERDYDAAAKEFAIALRALPNDADLLWSMAMMERRRNHWRSCIEGLQRCVSLNPRDLLTISHLGDNYVALHDYAAAEETRRRQIEVATTVSPEEIAVAKEELAFLHWIRSGSTVSLHALLRELPNDTKSSIRGPILLDLGIIERNVDTFLEGFSMIPDQDEMLQLEAMRAWQIKGDAQKANAIINAFIAKDEDLVQTNDTEARYHSVLGLWYAYADRKDEAIREGRRAAELVPEAKDAADGPMYTTNLAMIYARSGEPDRAMDLIEHLLTIPCSGDALQYRRELEVSWRWDPLRNNPRFQKLLAGPEPRISYK